MGFEHSLVPEVGEQFSSWHVLQEQVEISAVLCDAVEVDLSVVGVTMKGCEMVLSILYSLEMWSTCFTLMISSFFIILTHE